MSEIDVSPFRTSSVAYLHGLRESIKIDPVYQRQGGVWSRKNQQLLIDSIINRFDIPKIYLHEHADWVQDDGQRYKYSLVDGRQRLEAIWDFLDGKFSLSEDFETLSDGSKEAAGKNYNELTREHPQLAALFSATSLDVMIIRTQDVELIEEMFSRLNEAVPLNSAEKRNGWGGPLRQVSQELVGTTFFTDRLPFSNTRFRHLDLATKFFLWSERSGPADAKKQRLDDFWNELREDEEGSQRARAALDRAREVTAAMERTFLTKDRLLSSIGMVSVYFLLYQKLLSEQATLPLRTELEAFEKIRRVNRPKDEDTLSSPQRRLLEFDRLAQSPNDESALKYRLDVLAQYLERPSNFQPIPEDTAD